MQQCMKIYYSIFIWSSTCFGRYTAHHQEPKTALAASGFVYVEGCWTCGCWTLTASSNHTSNNFPRTHNQRLPVQFRLLVMGGVSPETCWATFKYGIINFHTLLHLVRFFCMNYKHVLGWQCCIHYGDFGKLLIATFRNRKRNTYFVWNQKHCLFSFAHKSFSSKNEPYPEKY
jgi:hypothetical protein